MKMPGMRYLPVWRKKGSCAEVGVLAADEEAEALEKAGAVVYRLGPDLTALPAKFTPGCAGWTGKASI